MKPLGDNLFAHLEKYKSKSAFKKAGGKIYNPVTLFEPDWKMLDLKRCPFCTLKLYPNRERTLFFCKSKKHRRFAVKGEKLI